MKNVFFGLLMVVTGSAQAGELYNWDLALNVFESHSGKFHQIPGVSSVMVTSCTAGVPIQLQGENAADVIPEACIQITFTDNQSLVNARAQYSSSFRLAGVLIYLGDVTNYGPEPGISVHN